MKICSYARSRRFPCRDVTSKPLSWKRRICLWQTFRKFRFFKQRLVQNRKEIVKRLFRSLTPLFGKCSQSKHNLKSLTNKFLFFSEIVEFGYEMFIIAQTYRVLINLPIDCFLPSTNWFVFVLLFIFFFFLTESFLSAIVKSGISSVISTHNPRQNKTKLSMKMLNITEFEQSRLDIQQNIFLWGKEPNLLN